MTPNLLIAGWKKGRARHWFALVLPVLLLPVCLSCFDDIEFNEFLVSQGADLTIQHTFAQLIADGDASKLSHYLALQVSPSSTKLLSPSTGAIRFRSEIDGLKNCLILSPEWRFSGTEFGGIGSGSPSPDQLNFCICNLDVESVQTAVKSVYSAQGNPSPETATAAFLDANHPDHGDHRTLAVYAPPESEDGDEPWSALGTASNGVLHLASYVWDDVDDNNIESTEERTYVNPAPYLAAVLHEGAVTIPELAIESVEMDVASSESFSDADTNTKQLGTTPPSDAGEAVEGVVRFRVKLSGGGGTPPAPYDFRYRLNKVSVVDNVVSNRTAQSQGRYHANAFKLGQANDVEGAIYAEIVAGAMWINIPLRATIPSRQIDPEWPKARNWTDPTLPSHVRLDAQSDGRQVFPPGTYELLIQTRSAFASVAEEARFYFLVGGVGLQTITAVHPMDGDFADGKAGRVLISDSHGSGSHTKTITTAGGTVAQDASSGTKPKVVVSAYVYPLEEDVTVYFEVIDPDDPSPYDEDSNPLTTYDFTDSDDHSIESPSNDNEPNDNRDPARTMAGGTYEKYLAFQNDLLSAHSATTKFAEIDGVSRAVAEVTLSITDRYAGDNYVVRATLQDPSGRPFNEDSGVEHFEEGQSTAGIDAGHISATTVLTAWKRLHCEVDYMYRWGSELSADVVQGSKTVRIKQLNQGFVLGASVRIADNTGMEALPHKIKSIVTDPMTAVTTLTLATEVTAGYSRFSGFVAVETAPFPDNADYYFVGLEKVPDTFDDAFIEIVAAKKYSGAVEFVDIMNGGHRAVFYAWRGESQPKANYLYMVGCNKGTKDGELVGGNTPFNEAKFGSSFVHVSEELNGGPLRISDIANHELVHNWDNVVPDAGSAAAIEQFASQAEHDTRMAHDGADKCLMNESRNTTNGIYELCIDHIYRLRDAPDKR